MAKGCGSMTENRLLGPRTDKKETAAPREVTIDAAFHFNHWHYPHNESKRGNA
jgi:hypothetical protein